MSLNLKFGDHVDINVNHFLLKLEIQWTLYDHVIA